MVHGSNEFNVI